MLWLKKLGIVFFLYIKLSFALQEINFPLNYDEDYIEEQPDKITSLPSTNYEEAKLEHLGEILTHILIQPWPLGISPLLYVENNSDKPSEEQEERSTLVDATIPSNAPLKRSRYYRKYPWKRQNSRYDAENRYLCQPSKEDVFRLLVALHDARQGNRGQMINFCNRRRPASVVFTNIRYLG